MPRQNVPYGGAICRLKERIAEIWDKLGEKLHSVNGVTGDATGDVKIVSGDAAVVVTSDQVNHEIEIALDSSQLPAAAVSSVNGQTGAVVLDASDINVIGGSDVATDLGNLDADLQQAQTDIAQEALARQNADSTLQTNINTMSAGIPAAAAAAVAADPTVAQLSNDVATLQTADGQNVKLSGSQNITGNKTVPTEGTGTFSQLIANSNKVKNELDNYAPMVRLSDYQVINGVKIFEGFPGSANTRNPSINITTPPAGDTIAGQWQFLDVNNVMLGNIIGVVTSDGSTYINILVRNRDGTYKTARLITSD